MSMIKNMQDFRDKARAIIDSEQSNKGTALLQLALNPPENKPHPGALPHIVTELLEQAGALEDCGRFKAALHKNPNNLTLALMEAYLQSFSAFIPPQS